MHSPHEEQARAKRNQTTTCMLCFDGKESQEHLFMHCRKTQRLWFTSPLGLHVPPLLSLSNRILHWLSTPNQTASQLFSLTLWRIWKNRNEAANFHWHVQQIGQFDDVSIVQDVSSFAEEFNAACRPTPGMNSSREPIPESSAGWKSTPLGVLKVNIDAGCFEDGNTCWGLIVRNHEGAVIMAKTKIENVSMTPILAEAAGL